MKEILKKIIEFLDKMPFKGWRTYIVTAIVAVVINYLPKLGIGITEELSAAVITITMAIVAFILRSITTGPVGTKNK